MAKNSLESPFKDKYVYDENFAPTLLKFINSVYTTDCASGEERDYIRYVAMRLCSYQEGKNVDCPFIEYDGKLRIVNDYTFAVRCKNFIKDTMMPDKEGRKEKKYLVKAINTLLEYQIATVDKYRLEYQYFKDLGYV